jgi:hypothetical protein
MVEQFGRKLKGKCSVQKWNRVIRAMIDQIYTSNTFSMVTRDCLRAWLNFISFKLVKPRTRKLGQKSSWSNSIPEHSIDWINIIDKFWDQLYVNQALKRKKWWWNEGERLWGLKSGLKAKTGLGCIIGIQKGLKCRKRVARTCLKI